MHAANKRDQEQAARETLAAAISYVASGLSVIPIRTDGSKAPDWRVLPLEWDEAEGKDKPSWKPFQERRATEDELRSWFGGRTGRGVAVVWGTVSGHGEPLDFDKPGLYERYAALCEELGHGPLIQSMPLVETPSGGRHLWYRCPEGIQGNQKLAQRLVDVPEGTQGARMIDGRRVKLDTLIETRGEGGYTLAPGSPTACHPDGRPYRFLRGQPDTIPTISAADRNILLALAGVFNEYVEPERVVDAPRPRRISPVTALRPGDDYNSRGDYEAVLERHGWRRKGQAGDKGVWQRPGKEGRGGSATSNYGGSGLFYPFSSNAAPFEAHRAYTPFAVYALLEHEGDFSAAAKALYADGFGDHTLKPTSLTPATLQSGEMAPAPDESKASPSCIPLSLVRALQPLPCDMTSSSLNIWPEASDEQRKGILYEVWHEASKAGGLFKIYIADAYLAIAKGQREKWVRDNFGDGNLQTIKNYVTVRRAWAGDRFVPGIAWTFYVLSSHKVFGGEYDRDELRRRFLLPKGHADKLTLEDIKRLKEERQAATPTQSSSRRSRFLTLNQSQPLGDVVEDDELGDLLGDCCEDLYAIRDLAGADYARDYMRQMLREKRQELEAQHQATMNVKNLDLWAGDTGNCNISSCENEEVPPNAYAPDIAVNFANVAPAHIDLFASAFADASASIRSQTSRILTFETGVGDVLSDDCPAPAAPPPDIFPSLAPVAECLRERSWPRCLGRYERFAGVDDAPVVDLDSPVQGQVEALRRLWDAAHPPG